MTRKQIILRAAEILEEMLPATRRGCCIAITMATYEDYGMDYMQWRDDESPRSAYAEAVADGLKKDFADFYGRATGKFWFPMARRYEFLDEQSVRAAANREIRILWLLWYAESLEA